MKLNLLERIGILSILPDEGDYSTLKIINNLKQSVAPSEEEYKEFQIQQIGDKLTWNQFGQEEREIPIGEKASDIIREALKELDKNKKLHRDSFTLYEKFIEG